MATFTPQMQSLLPSPPQESKVEPINEALKNADSFRLLSIEAMMVVAVVMSCIMLFGSLRKRTSNAFFNLCLWVTVVSTPLFISYLVGQLTSNTDGSLLLNNELFLIWGILLLTGLASYGTISAFELEGSETALVAYVQGSLKCGFVFGMLLDYNGKHIPLYIKWILHILVPFMLLGLFDRASALARASKTNVSHGVGWVVEAIYDYMEWDVEKTLKAGEEEAADPKSMGGYRYLVGIKSVLNDDYKCQPPCYSRDFEREKDAHVTTLEIWQCEGELLSSRGGDPQGRLKDTCLSFALFWLLLRRYPGYPLAEVTSLEEKTWNFVRYGLTPDISVAASERAFRVIEQELSFLYDYFYTKNFVIYMNGTRFMLFRFILMIAFFLISLKILKSHKTSLSVEYSDHHKAIDLDSLITKVVLLTMLMSELVILVHYLFITQWSRVEWVCTYVRKQLWNSQTWEDKCLRRAIELICLHSLHRNFKHWKQEIGQYSLLLSHRYISPTYYFRYIIPEILLDKPKRGRKASKSVPFCISLKKAVLSSLHINGQKLSNGKSSMRKYGLETDDFSWALNLQTHTQTILVWHIATSFCELSHSHRYHGHLNSDDLLVAASLSKYCAYLVAFVPELLPDQKNITYNIINNVILEANAMFKGCRNMEAKYEKMMAMTDECNGAKDPILKKGIWLGKSLVNTMSNEYESLWQLLVEFWAELLLYLAPSDDVAAHIKHLANGGELITHLWTLLTHAGIIKRD